MKSVGTDLAKSLGSFSLERFAISARADLRFGPLNILIMVAVFVIGLVVHLVLYSFTVEAVLYALGSAVGAYAIRIKDAEKSLVPLSSRGYSQHRREPTSSRPGASAGGSAAARGRQRTRSLALGVRLAARTPGQPRRRRLRELPRSCSSEAWPRTELPDALRVSFRHGIIAH